MAVLACAYGVLKAGSIWYPINLRRSSTPNLLSRPARLYSFHADTRDRLSRMAGVNPVVSARCFPCSRAGRLYWRLIGPVLWSGLFTQYWAFSIHCSSHIDWPWFIASQVAFGIVAGIVVTKQSRMLTGRTCPSSCALELKLRDYPPRATERRTVKRFQYLCASAVLSLLLGQLSAWSAPRGPEGSADPGLTLPLYHKIVQVATARTDEEEQRLRVKS
jgi:hypothetical protein